MKEIDGENAYPIYKFSFSWTQDSVPEDGPKVIISNGTGFSKMFKEEKTQSELDAIAKEWWDQYLSKNEEINPVLKNSKAYFFEFETWHLTWFQHETFDAGQTDEQALDNFEKFVRRKEPMLEKFTLMGAEDRWRWHGTDGESGDMPAPCRCKHCKEQGLIRIAH